MLGSETGVVQEWLSEFKVGGPDFSYHSICTDNKSVSFFLAKHSAVYRLMPERDFTITKNPSHWESDIPENAGKRSYFEQCVSLMAIYCCQQKQCFQCCCVFDFQCKSGSDRISEGWSLMASIWPRDPLLWALCPQLIWDQSSILQKKKRMSREQFWPALSKANLRLVRCSLQYYSGTWKTALSSSCDWTVKSIH